MAIREWWYFGSYKSKLSIPHGAFFSSLDFDELASEWHYWGDGAKYTYTLVLASSGKDNGAKRGGVGWE